MCVCLFLFVCNIYRSKEKIKLNVWNTVNLERANRKGEINTNGKDPVKGESPVCQLSKHRSMSVYVCVGVRVHVGVCMGVAHA